jgi:hypothetical protein
MNNLPFLFVVTGGFLIGGLVFFFLTFGSHEFLEVGYKPNQPIEFSHEKHVADAGIDCAYCHSGARSEVHARIPETEVCMGCHLYVRPFSPKLTPLRQAYLKKEPIEWNRVHLLPQYVSFHHGAHIQAGVPCQECHGNVNIMEEAYQSKPLSMAFCLDCHNNLSGRLVPLDRVTEIGFDDKSYDPLTDPFRLRQPQPQVQCSICHY